MYLVAIFNAAVSVYLKIEGNQPGQIANSNYHVPVVTSRLGPGSKDC